CEALGSARARSLFYRIGNECCNDAVANPPDPNATLPAVMILGYRLGFRIGHVDDVVLVDEDTARPAELEPLIHVVALLIENLDTIVVAVTEEQPPARIHCDGVRNVDLAKLAAFLSQCFTDLPVFTNFHGGAFRFPPGPTGKKIPPFGGAKIHSRRFNLMGPSPSHSRLAEPQQYLPVGTELDHLVTLAIPSKPVGHPDIAVTIDVEAMWKDEQPRTEALHQLAGSIEFEDRVEVRAIAGEWNPWFHARRQRSFATSIGYPDATSVGIDTDCAG